MKNKIINYNNLQANIYFLKMLFIIKIKSILKNKKKI